MPAVYAPVMIQLTAVEYSISYGPSEDLRPPQDDIAHGSVKLLAFGALDLVAD